MHRATALPARSAGFTLREVTVSLVVAAGLACVLAPMTEPARAASRAGGCAFNIGQLSRAVISHAADTDSFLPSYVYGSSTTGTSWTFPDQTDTAVNPLNGIIHWSGFLLADGYVAAPETFKCESALNGGAPATDPGPAAADWEPGQVDGVGHAGPSTLPNDRQAKRMAYTANAAIMPRNKFNGFSPRKNRLAPFAEVPRIQDTDSPTVVRPSNITRPSSTILLTEFVFTPAASWQTIAAPSGGGWWFSKSHRPITPFVGRSTGTDVYAEPAAGGSPRFAYPSVSSLYPTAALGPSMILDFNTELNAVGRHHPGETANFARLDGSVQEETVLQTIQRREWGDRFYSITGRNDVDMR